jgi:SPP1 gp7 family putative phage head morphogenesis protein
MTAMAILPSNIHDPTGQDARERAAIRDFNARLARCRTLYVQALAAIPSRRITVNAQITQYDLTPELLASVLDDLGAQVDRILLEGGPNDLWFTGAYVEPAYQQGTAQQVTNLSVQSATYAASRPNLTQLLSSDAYRTRLGFLRVRVADTLSGYAAEVKNRMAQVLQDGLAVGRGAREIARRLTAATGISSRKAETIARTEVPGALRAGRLEEAQQATGDLGIQSREMHFSALSPTTRPSHRARHGKLYTVQQQREWWAVVPNMINCKCSTVTVLVNAKGEPLTPGIIDRARALLAKNPASELA